MRILALCTSILAFLACVPNTAMSRANFLKCVSGSRDETRIAIRYGLPQTITTYTTAQTLNTLDQHGTTWIYTRGTSRFFHFDAAGHLIPKTNGKHATTPQ